MLGGGAPQNRVIVRYMFIVSRSHAWLYRHLVERFEGDPDVSVVLDRRVKERRVAPGTVTVPQERRRGERRRPFSAEHDLTVRSHYIVEL